MPNSAVAGNSSGEVTTVELGQFPAKLEKDQKTLDEPMENERDFVKPNSLVKPESRMNARPGTKRPKRDHTEVDNPALIGDEEEGRADVGQGEREEKIVSCEKAKQESRSFASLIEENLNTTFANSIENQVSYNNNEVKVESLHVEDFTLTVGYTTNALTIPGSCYNVTKDLKRLMSDMKNSQVKGYFYIFRRTDDVRLHDFNESPAQYPHQKCCIVMPLELANNFFTNAGLARRIQAMCHKLVDKWKRDNRKDSVRPSIPSTDVVIFELKTDTRHWTFAYMLTCSLFRYMNKHDYDPTAEPGFDDIRIHLKLATNLPSMRYLALRNNSKSYITPTGVEVYRSKYGFFSSATDFLSLFRHSSVQKLLELADVQTKY